MQKIKKNSCLEWIEALVCVVASFSSMLYFPLVELLKTFAVNVRVSTYLLYNYSVFTVSITATILSIVARRCKLTIHIVKGVALIVLILLIYIVYGIFVNEDRTYFLYFVLWAIPALMVSLLIPVSNNTKIVSLLEIISLIMGVTAFISAMKYLTSGISHLNTLSFGGTNYQGLAYTAAFCVGLELYFAFVIEDTCKLRFFRRGIGKTVEALTAFIAAFAVFVSGGRGGLLLLILNIILCFFMVQTKIKTSKSNVRIRSVFFLILAVCLACMFISKYGKNEMVGSSLERLSTIMTLEDSESTYTAGRITIVSNAIQLIKEKPLFGYGLFNLKDTYGMVYPHNIILETWMHAGFFYMLFWLGIVIRLWIMSYRLIADRSSQNAWIVFFIAYSTIFLNVSGTYLWCSEIWFSIGVMLSYNALRG